MIDLVSGLRNSLTDELRGIYTEWYTGSTTLLVFGFFHMFKMPWDLFESKAAGLHNPSYDLLTQDRL